jgi:FixJ family two-component response regulator
MIAAYGDNAMYHQAMQLDAVDFLTKPMDFTQLK